jgi:DNA-binding transcriptional LysR family regulator
VELAGLVQAGAVDIALVTEHEGLHDFEMIREEPLVWVASQRFKPPINEPIPLALGSAACIWRRVADIALEGRKHRVRGLFMSKNYTAIGTIVRAGLAVTVLPEGMITEGLRPIGLEAGLPRLPNSRMGLIRAPGVHSEEAKALAEAIRATVAEAQRKAA